MTQLPNPFLNSTVSPRAVGSAVASSDLQPRATAEQISQSTLDPATGVDAAAGPEFADPPVPAAVAISSSCGGTNAHQSRERCADNRPAFSEAVEVASGPHEAIPSNGGRCQETPASAPSKNPDVGVLDHIHEIFFYARKLMKAHRASMCSGCENPEFAYETVDGGAMYRCADCGKSVHFSGADLAASSTIDEVAFEASIDEIPLFLREDGYLKRQA